MSENLVKITIDGQEVEVPEGSPLIDACNNNGCGIPSFCYYSDLKVQASCRMCLVRIEKMPKLQASCSIPVREGMVVTTKSEEIEKSQRAMGEFLLANHPLDCPVCDRGGECELQEVIFDWGDIEGRFHENKNAHPEKYLSPMVANDQQRCILCKRCTRVCHEWMGEDVIEAANRGANSVIGTYGGWLDCSQCGNCVEVCPTGTLLDGVYKHSTRPWELDQTITTDTYGSDGMQLSIGSRAGEVHRIVARDRYVNGLNGEFLDVKARFAHEFINHPDRIRTPLVRYKKGGKLIPATWDDALGMIAERFAATTSNIGVIASSRLTNEAIFTLKRFARDVLANDNFAISDAYDLAPLFENLSAPLSTHKEIRYAKTILLIGGEPEEEQTFTAKQIRQAADKNNAKLIIVNETPIRLTATATQFLHVNTGSIEAFAPALLSGDETACAKMGVSKDEVTQIKNTLAETAGDIIVMIGGNLSKHSQAVFAGVAKNLGGESSRVLIHPLPLYNNSIGANDMMEGKRTFEDVIETSNVLLIGGGVYDISGLAGKEFVVVQEMFENETTEYADIVLPAASFAEVDGTYTNNAGNVQRVRKAIEPVYQSRADWMITAAIAKKMGVDFGYEMSASAVFRDIAESVSIYQGLRYPDLRDESNPVQIKHSINETADISASLERLSGGIASLVDNGKKNEVTPKVGHKLFRLTTMTEKTMQFHLLANGNPKPESLFVSPLSQMNPDGSPKSAETEAATVN
ncbi:MAG: molybdopterin-dependent oxidoreductase [Pyrinomonadaceae bacterium]